MSPPFKLFLLIAAALFALVITGCASCPTPPPQVVEVPGPVQYVEIPSGLLIPCAVPDMGTPQTNGELLEQWRLRREAMEACGARIDAIRKFQAGN